MTQKVHRRRVLQGIGGAAIAGLAGCTTSDEGSQGTAVSLEDRSSAIKLGVLMPETGDLAELGQPIRDAALLPAKQLNDADLPVEFDTQVEDTQTNPTAGVSAAEALVNSGYPMVTGPASSGVNLQVTREVLIPSEVVGCSPSSTSPAVTDLEDNDYVFRTAPSDALQGQVLAQVASDRRDASTAATMYVNNSYGQSLSESFAGAFEDNGGTVQTQVSFEKEQSSYTSRLDNATADDPDILIVIGYPASGVQLFRDYYSDFSSDRTVMVTDGLQSADLPSQVGNDMENVIGSAPLPSGPQVDTFNELYRSEYDRSPGVFNAQAYDASAVMILANIAAGGNNGTNVRDKLRTVANPDGTTVGPENLAEAAEMVGNGESVNYAGASSSVDFDDNGDMAAVSYEVWEFAPDSESGFSQLTTVDFEA